MAGWKWGSRCLPTSAVQCPDWPIALDHHCRVLMREWYCSDVGNPRTASRMAGINPEVGTYEPLRTEGIDGVWESARADTHPGYGFG
jgi:hypothetical protein